MHPLVSFHHFSFIPCPYHLFFRNSSKMWTRIYNLLAFVLVFGSVTGQKEPITLDDILTGRYSATGFSGVWSSDGRIQTTVGATINRLNLTSGQSEDVIGGANFSNYTGYSIQLSPDDKFVLITYARKNLWRHSFTAKYDVYDVTTRAFYRLIPAGGSNDDVLQLVRWAPTGNALAFVHKNNLYYKANANRDTVVTQVTTDGDEFIMNGHSDWVYEEEMFGTNQAFWFSRNGTWLAYMRFDDTLVDKFTYPLYGEPGDKNHIYPRMVRIPYPKAGKTNPSYELYVTPLDTVAPKIVGFNPSTPTTNLHYIGHVTWANDNELFVVTMNREQNASHWHYCDPNAVSAHCVSTFSYNNDWVDISAPRFSADGHSFLTITGHLATNGSTYNHLTHVTKTGNSTHLTTGTYTVTSILAWDEPNARVFFMGTNITGATTHDPSQTHLYSTPTSQVPNPNPKCHTCDLVNNWNEACKGNGISLSPDRTRFIHTCQAVLQPADIVLRTVDNETYIERTWQNNSVVRSRLEDAAIPIPLDFPESVPLPNTPNTAKVRVFLPPSYTPGNGIKYPMLVDVYGGPGSQNVGQGYSINWGMSMVSDREIIYAYIDGRGSARQSLEHLFQLNRKLGTVEIEDQITVAKYLINNLTFVDPDRTAIWGWSYGGYATARVMQTDTDHVFKCGILVAPVTSWRYYDSIYTERFMKLPTLGDNEAGYDQSDVTTNVTNFHNKKFFLVHGNADDNVHYQQSMILARKLEQEDVMFHQLSYPDENHGINGQGMRKHLYHSLEEFLFQECFEGSFVPPSTTGNPNPSTSTPSSASLLSMTVTMTIVISFATLLSYFK